jgi:hypothetical protein
LGHDIGPGGGVLRWQRIGETESRDGPNDQVMVESVPPDRPVQRGGEISSLVGRSLGLRSV